MSFETIIVANSKQKSGKFTNIGKLNTIQLTTIGSKKKSKEKLKNTLRQMKMKLYHAKIYEIHKKHF